MNLGKIVLNIYRLTLYYYDFLVVYLLQNYIKFRGIFRTLSTIFSLPPLSFVIFDMYSGFCKKNKSQPIRPYNNRNLLRILTCYFMRDISAHSKTTAFTFNRHNFLILVTGESWNSQHFDY